MKKLNIAKGIDSMERENYPTRGVKPQMLRGEFSAGFLKFILNSYHMLIVLLGCPRLIIWCKAIFTKIKFN